MNVHWLAIEKETSSYLELKARRVVAVGWGGVGDITSLLPLVRAGKEVGYEPFVREVVARERAFYPSPWHGGYYGGEVLWHLLSVRAGDLVVGIEGTKVRGLCQVEVAGVDSYRCEMPLWAYHYGETIGFPVTWIDWNVAIFGVTPQPPRRGVRGIKYLNNERERIMAIWAANGYSPNGDVDGSIF